MVKASGCASEGGQQPCAHQLNVNVCCEFHVHACPKSIALIIGAQCTWFHVCWRAGNPLEATGAHVVLSETIEATGARVVLSETISFTCAVCLL